LTDEPRRVNTTSRFKTSCAMYAVSIVNDQNFEGPQCPRLQIQAVQEGLDEMHNYIKTLA